MKNSLRVLTLGLVAAVALCSADAFAMDLLRAKRQEMTQKVQGASSAIKNFAYRNKVKIAVAAIAVALGVTIVTAVTIRNKVNRLMADLQLRDVSPEIASTLIVFYSTMPKDVLTASLKAYFEGDANIAAKVRNDLGLYAAVIKEFALNTNHLSVDEIVSQIQDIMATSSLQIAKQLTKSEMGKVWYSIKDSARWTSQMVRSNPRYMEIKQAIANAIMRRK